MDVTRPALQIVPATERDVPVILQMIKGLAEYQRLADHVTATEEQLRTTLFGARPAAEVVIGYAGDEPVGFALFFQNYSTFLAQPGIYLEDLFVVPEARGHGYGRQLLARLAKIAAERDCGRLEWASGEAGSTGALSAAVVAAEPPRRPRAPTPRATREPRALRRGRPTLESRALSAGEPRRPASRPPRSRDDEAGRSHDLAHFRCGFSFVEGARCRSEAGEVAHPRSVPGLDGVDRRSAARVRVTSPASPDLCMRLCRGLRTRPRSSGTWPDPRSCRGSRTRDVSPPHGRGRFSTPSHEHVRPSRAALERGRARRRLRRCARCCRSENAACRYSSVRAKFRIAGVRARCGAPPLGYGECSEQRCASDEHFAPGATPANRRRRAPRESHRLGQSSCSLSSPVISPRIGQPTSRSSSCSRLGDLIGSLRTSSGWGRGSCRRSRGSSRRAASTETIFAALRARPW